VAPHEPLDCLFTRFYPELLTIAARRRRGWPGNETLDETSLLHEVYLRLAGQEGSPRYSPAHFLAVASVAMRRVLIDHARSRLRIKRGGGAPEVSAEALEGALLTGSGDASPSDLVIALDEALHRLATTNVRLARIVDCRFFGEMTIEETAAALGTSTATVKRGWVLARAWLRLEMSAPSTR